MKITGAQAIVECLKNEQVELLFGYPGGSVLPLYDALYTNEFPHILPRHEQGAIHAADAYARVTGKVGVCLATSGPGATNLITGIAAAHMDSSPLVILTGQVFVSLIGRDSFQEADIWGITTPITKHNYLVKNAKDIPRVFKEAFYIAQTGRPGPVLIDMAKDIFTQEIDFFYPDALSMRGYHPVFAGCEADVEGACELLAQAEKPLFFVGGGVNLSGVSEVMREVVSYTGIPAVASLMGLGSVPSSDPNFFGMIGMHGTYVGNMATIETDLLVGVGVRFDDRVTGALNKFAPRAKIVHFDIDAAEINKNVRADLQVLGDLRWSLAALSRKMRTQPSEVWHTGVAAWKERLAGWRAECPMSYDREAEAVLPQAVIAKVAEVTQGQAIVVTDVGQHQMWTAQFFDFCLPRSFVTSGGLGTMGYGVPAAIGAHVGRPESQVVCFCGDGGFMMTCQELMTAADLGLPIKVFLLNNGYLGMVAQWQRKFFNRHYAHTRFETKADFVALARAMGCTALRLDAKEDMDAVVREALNTPGPVLVEVLIPPEEDVVPMVPPGMGLDEMILES
ncbi:MAG: biosynthetic-type acetolactate synthase large subunit [Peptococcaceae bacterium]|nr:biosynthetic-type acetolactate synthase large subunit [Peptococcaceae bacterium]